MEQILPLVKKYDAAIIALPNDEDEIPMEADKRIDLTRKIIEVATKEYGIADRGHRDRPAGDADRRRPAGRQRRRLETMRRIRDEFGVNMTCGASNVSFGMPGRHALGSAFLPMAMTAGLTSAIMDTRTPEIVEAVKAADLLLGHDEWGGNWIAAHRARQAARSRGRPDEPASRVTDGPDFSLADVRREGLIEPSGADQATHDGTGRVDAHVHRRHRSGRRADPARRTRARRASPSSTRRRGTASRSTPPAAATAPATSARCGSRATPVPITRHDVRTFTPDQIADGWRLACLVQATRDLEVDVPPLTTRPKAATVGVGRQVILRPAAPEAVRRARRADASPTSAPTWSG